MLNARGRPIPNACAETLCEAVALIQTYPNEWERLQARGYRCVKVRLTPVER